jgi:hypothetical protein
VRNKYVKMKSYSHGDICYVTIAAPTGNSVAKTSMTLMRCSHRYDGDNNPMIMKIVEEMTLVYTSRTHSFLMTSNGLVSTAPAIPAATDFTADRDSWVFCNDYRRCVRWLTGWKSARE